MLKFNAYPDFAALSLALANKWIALISSTPADQPCSFALAGGTTPAPLYHQFDTLFASAQQRLTQPRSIQLVATDERWVPDSDPQSNEGMLRRCFAQSALHWNLLSLKNNQPYPTNAITEINLRLQTYCNHPFRAVILGMGADGHIASLFPDAPQLLTCEEKSSCVAATHPQTGQARISLSLARLLNTKSIWILITGAEKRTVLERALQENKSATPIGALLAAAHYDVDVCWCP